MSQSLKVQIPRNVEALNDQGISICCSQLTNQVQNLVKKFQLKIKI